MIQKARQQYVNSAGESKPLSQGDLAQMLNVKSTIVQECESVRSNRISFQKLTRAMVSHSNLSDENMKAKPDPAVLGKMERILKVKLRGANLGQPLGQPKKK